MTSNVVEGLKPLLINISELTYDPTNARKHSTKNIAAIKLSLEEFGQHRPIVVQRDGMVIRAGNGTCEAAKLLGWDQIAAVIVDEDDTSATARGIADNRCGELAEWDDDVLSDLMCALNDDSFNLDVTGFDEYESASFIQEAFDLSDNLASPTPARENPVAIEVEPDASSFDAMGGVDDDEIERGETERRRAAEPPRIPDAPIQFYKVAIQEDHYETVQAAATEWMQVNNAGGSTVATAIAMICAEYLDARK